MRELKYLEPGFRMKVEALLTNCKAMGIEMRPFFTLRDPIEQAKLWRQSRSREQVLSRVQSLRKQGCNYLADCIIDAGPQSGRWATNAIPGLSWHQWGLAIDCFWVVNGNAEWSSERLINGKNGYKVYVEEAKKLGLISGSSYNDWPHIQAPKEDSPLDLYSIQEIDRKMKETFPTK